MGYPIVVNLTGKKVVVVGGGHVAQRRLAGLVGQNADIRVVAPDATEEIGRLSQAGVIEHLVKHYESDDLEGAFLTVAATNDAVVNEAVAVDATAQSILVCRTDVPDGGNFITPAVIDRGDLLIAITTGGENPTLAAVLKERLEDEFGPEWRLWPRLFGTIRDAIQTIPSAVGRRAAVRSLLADPMITSLIVAGNLEAAMEAAGRQCT